MSHKKIVLFCSCVIFGVVATFILKVTLKQESTQEILTKIGQKKFSGVILIADKEKILFEKGFGFASCNESIANSPDTVQAIGSITKMFTKVAIAQLDANGLLNIDNPVSQYINDMPEDKASISIRQLLEHTSGLDTYHETSKLGDFEPMTKIEAFNEIMHRPLLFSPGSKQEYSNSGYTLLALLIETISGMNYTKYVRDNILLPAGMVSTGFWGESFQPIASTSNSILGCSSPAQWDYSWVLVGNGGMVSTAKDLHRWIRALKENDLLDETAKKRIGFDTLMREGFGDAGGSSQHEFNATIEYNGQYDITVIAISNDSSLSAESFAAKLLQSAVRQKELKN